MKARKICSSKIIFTKRLILTFEVGILRPTTAYEKRETLLLKYEGTNFYVKRLRAMGPIGPGAKKGRLDIV